MQPLKLQATGTAHALLILTGVCSVWSLVYMVLCRSAWCGAGVRGAVQVHMVLCKRA